MVLDTMETLPAKTQHLTQIDCVACREISTAIWPSNHEKNSKLSESSECAFDSVYVDVGFFCQALTPGVDLPSLTMNKPQIHQGLENRFVGRAEVATTNNSPKHRLV